MKTRHIHTHFLEVSITPPKIVGGCVCVLERENVYEDMCMSVYVSVYMSVYVSVYVLES